MSAVSLLVFAFAAAQWLSAKLMKHLAPLTLIELGDNRRQSSSSKLVLEHRGLRFDCFTPAPPVRGPQFGSQAYFAWQALMRKHEVDPVLSG
jgi:hypothetical protein